MPLRVFAEQRSRTLSSITILQCGGLPDLAASLALLEAWTWHCEETTDRVLSTEHFNPDTLLGAYYASTRAALSKLTLLMWTYSASAQTFAAILRRRPVGLLQINAFNLRYHLLVTIFDFQNTIYAKMHVPAIGRPTSPFPSHTLCVMMQSFDRNAYPSTKEVLRLACETNLCEAQIARWFVNQRHRTKKRAKEGLLRRRPNRAIAPHPDRAASDDAEEGPALAALPEAVVDGLKERYAAMTGTEEYFTRTGSSAVEEEFYNIIMGGSCGMPEYF